MANSVDPDQNTSLSAVSDPQILKLNPKGAVCSGSTLFASILNLSVMLGNCLQQTTFLDVFFS